MLQFLSEYLIDVRLGALTVTANFLSLPGDIATSSIDITSQALALKECNFAVSVVFDFGSGELSMTGRNPWNDVVDDAGDGGAGGGRGSLWLIALYSLKYSCISIDPVLKDSCILTMSSSTSCSTSWSKM